MVTIYEYVVDLMIEIEDLMGVLYNKLIEFCESPTTKVILKYINIDGTKHLNIVNELKGFLVDSIQSSARIINKLRSFRNDLVSTKKLLIELVREAEAGKFRCTPENLENYLMKLERIEMLSYNFYKFIINFIPTKSKEISLILSYIIDDENKHRELLKMAIEDLKSRTTAVS